MKSKLGIHIGFLACICFLVAQFGGLVPLILLAGYILLFEENYFLRMSALKALLIVLASSVLTTLINLIPDVLFNLINWFTRIFGADTTFNNLKAISKITQIFSFLAWLVSTAKMLLLLLLAFLACRIKTIKLPFVDKLYDKYCDALK